jgi:release factor glutamine methyltransferase
MTVADAVASVESRLVAAGVDTPRLNAHMLVAHALGVERSWVLAHSADPFGAGEALEKLCERREAREPLAYILGWREFYGRRFRVTPDVLIPRQETETLVETALEEKHIQGVLDIGTGSGCIAITLACERPEWNVTAVDISEPALAIARENAQRLLPSESPNLGTNPDQPELIQSDLFAALSDRQFDLIVSNPPYVAATDLLPPEVHAHEPHTALYADNQGLAIYIQLAEEAQSHLRPGGALIVEIGDGQSEAVQSIFEEHGWHIERVVNDLDGTPRVMVARPLFAA